MLLRTVVMTCEGRGINAESQMTSKVGCVTPTRRVRKEEKKKRIAKTLQM